MLIAELLFYAAAGCAWLLESVHAPRPRLLALPQYFVLANVASFLAFYKFLRGERYARWEPTREPLAPTAMPAQASGGKVADAEMADIAG
jgi:hypothetical protein